MKKIPSISCRQSVHSYLVAQAHLILEGHMKTRTKERTSDKVTILARLPLHQFPAPSLLLVTMKTRKRMLILIIRSTSLAQATETWMTEMCGMNAEPQGAYHSAPIIAIATEGNQK